MIQYVAEHASVCMLAVASLVGAGAVAADRRTTRRWRPLIVRKGEIVAGLNTDNPINVLPPRDRR